MTSINCLHTGRVFKSQRNGIEYPPLPKSNEMTPLNPCLADSPWYVVLTKPRQEVLARENLARQGYFAYLPRLKVLKRGRSRQEVRLEPLFPRYMFVQPSSSQHSISPVRSTHGVAALVRFGFTLAVLRPETLRGLREFESRQNARDFELLSPFHPGTKVSVSDGPLIGLEGLVSSVSRERVIVLMQLLGHDTRVNMTHHQLQLVA